MKETPCPADKGEFAKEFYRMKNNIYELNLTAAVALSEAARSAGVNTNEITDEEITLDNGYYEVRFTSDWLQYDCYVDAATGEVPASPPCPSPRPDNVRHAKPAPPEKREAPVFSLRRWRDQAAAAFASSVALNGFLRMM